MRISYRPLDAWPWPQTAERYANPFGRADWNSTLNKLEHEVEMLRGDLVVIQADFTERDLRLNGDIRVGADPATPRVVVAFESMHGPIKMKCDRFHGWRVNVRAVAHGLEALRKIERYGIATRGEQYTGWKQLPPSTIALGASTLTREEAAELLVRTAGTPWYGDDMRDAIENLLEDTETLLPLVFKYAARIAHPDQGGDEDAFKRIGQARDLLAST